MHEKTQNRAATCPKCKGHDVKAYDSRPTIYKKMYSAIRRRRVCACGNRWLTYELSNKDLDEYHFKMLQDSFNFGVQLMPFSINYRLASFKKLARSYGLR